MVQIDRTNVIDGARDAAEPDRSPVVVTDVDFVIQPQTHQVTLTAAQLQTLNTVPVVVLPELPHGHKAQVLGVYYEKADGAYTNTSGGAVTVNYQDGGNTLAATIPVAHIRNANAKSGWATRPNQSGTPATFSVPDGALEATAPADFAGAGGDLTLTLVYLEVDA